MGTMCFKDKTHPQSDKVSIRYDGSQREKKFSWQLNEVFSLSNNIK